MLFDCSGLKLLDRIAPAAMANHLEDGKVEGANEGKRSAKTTRVHLKYLRNCTPFLGIQGSTPNTPVGAQVVPGSCHVRSDHSVIPHPLRYVFRFPTYVSPL